MATVGIITGAGSGMGAACVPLLRGTVDHLLAVDVRAPDIDGTVGVACDISDAGAIAALVEQVRSQGSLRAVVHAAGLSPSMGDSRKIVVVNLLGTVALLNGLEPLVEDGSAAVCFSSTAGYLPLELLDPALTELLADLEAPGLLDRAAELLPDPGLAYAWSKKGVQVAAARAAVRWAERGGRVVSLSPGSIDTPMGRLELENQPMMRQQLADHPLGRLGRAEEVAAVAAFLVSEQSSFVSGIDVLVDGGAQAAALEALAALDLG